MTNEMNEQKVAYKKRKSRFPLELVHVNVVGESYDFKGHRYENSSHGIVYSQNGKEYIDNADLEGNYGFVPKGRENVKGVITSVSFDNDGVTIGEYPLRHEMSFKDFVRFGKPTSLEAMTEISFYKK